jgi:hypothetical protein
VTNSKPRLDCVRWRLPGSAIAAAITGGTGVLGASGTGASGAGTCVAGACVAGACVAGALVAGALVSCCHRVGLGVLVRESHSVLGEGKL